MAKNVNLKVFGIKTSQAYLASKVLTTTINAIKGVKESGEILKGEVKDSIEGNRAEPRSVDKGDFLKSVDMVQGDMSVTVFSDIGHAKPLEYGTSRIKARRHFNNSLDRNQSKIKGIIGNNIK